MSFPRQFAFHVLQLGPHPLWDGDPPDPEPSVLVRVADVRKSQEVEGLWRPKAPCPSLLGGTPPELDQPCLLRVHLQGQFGETFAEVRPEPLGVSPVLKTEDKVVRVAHDDHATACMAA